MQEILLGLRGPGEVGIEAGFPDEVLNLFRTKLVGFNLQQILRVVQVQVPSLNGFVLLQLIQLRLYPVYTLYTVDIRLEEVRTHNPGFPVPPPLLCRSRLKGIRRNRIFLKRKSILMLAKMFRDPYDNKGFCRHKRGMTLRQFLDR
jgi:hypothetical protein